MKTQLQRLYDGKTDWTAFATQTKSEWTKLAGRLYGLHKLPACVGIEDIRQELLVWAWHFMAKWSPDGGQPLHRYVVIGSMNRAHRWLNRQRNSYRRCDGAPSRLHELAEDMSGHSRGGGARGAGDYECAFDWLVWSEPLQEVFVARREMVELRIKSACTARERLCIEAILEANGDIEASVDVLFDDKKRRRLCRFEKRNDVRHGGHHQHFLEEEYQREIPEYTAA